MNDALGKSLLREWYDAAKSYPGNFQFLSFEQFLAFIQKGNANFVSNFGSAARSAIANVGDSVIRRGMRDLAIRTQGMLPTYEDGFIRTQVFFNVLISKSDPSLLNANFLKKVVPEVAADSVKAAAKFGSGLLNTYVLFSALGIGVALYFLIRKK